MLSSRVSIGAADDYPDRLISNADRIDQLHLMKPLTGPIGSSNCDVQQALAAILAGNKGQFMDALKQAGDKKQDSAKALSAIAGNKQFERQIDTKGLRLLSPNLKPEERRTGNDILRSMSFLEGQCRKRSNLILKGKGSDYDITTIAQKRTERCGNASSRVLPNSCSEVS